MSAICEGNSEVGTDWKLEYGRCLACSNRKAEYVDVTSNNIDLVYSFFSAEYGEENDDEEEEQVHCKLCTFYNARLRAFPSISLHGRAGWLS